MADVYSLAPELVAGEDESNEYSLVWLDADGNEWTGRLLWDRRLQSWYIDAKCEALGEVVEGLRVSLGMVGMYERTELGMMTIAVTADDDGQCEVLFDDLFSGRVDILIYPAPKHEYRTESTAGWTVTW